MFRRYRREQLAVAERPKIGDQREQPDHEPEIADSVDDKGLPAGVGGKLLLIIKTYEQIGAETDTFPANEHDQIVVAQNESEHRPHKQVQVGEVALKAIFVGHIADGVDMDQGANEGDKEDHHRGQRVEHETERNAEVSKCAPFGCHLEITGRDPVVELYLEAGVLLMLRATHEASYRGYRKEAG